MANNRLQSISQNADERARFRSHRMWIMDRDNDMAVAREQGKAEGIAEGKAEGVEETKIALAKNLLHTDMDIDRIREMIGLNSETIRSLQKEIGNR